MNVIGYSYYPCMCYNPYVKGVTVEGKVVKQGKGKKLTIFTYVPNKRSTRKKQGHRQPYTKIEITNIK